MLHLLAEIGEVWHWQFEVDFILWLQGLFAEGTFAYSVLFYFMNFVTMFGEELFSIAIMGFVYWGLDKKRGERIAAALLTTALFNPLLKNIFRRTRPFHSGTGIKNLRDVHGYSFPSGHSSGAASIFVGTAVAYKDKKQKWLWILAIVVPVLVALSRNYLGAHYLSDVVCGLALGAGVVFLLEYLYKVIKNKYLIYLGIIVIGFAGMFYCDTEDFFTGYGLLIGFVAGVYFEEKITKFENTKVWWQIIIRLIVGGGLYLGINALIKLPFGFLFDANGDVLSQWVIFERIFRTVRYAIIVFLCIGIYPMLFKYFDKLGGKKVEKSEQQKVETEIES